MFLTFITLLIIFEINMLLNKWNYQIWLLFVLLPTIIGIIFIWGIQWVVTIRRLRDLWINPWVVVFVFNINFITECKNMSNLTEAICGKLSTIEKYFENKEFDKLDFSVYSVIEDNKNNLKDEEKDYIKKHIFKVNDYFLKAGQNIQNELIEKGFIEYFAEIVSLYKDDENLQKIVLDYLQKFWWKFRKSDYYFWLKAFLFTKSELENNEEYKKLFSNLPVRIAFFVFWYENKYLLNQSEYLNFIYNNIYYLFEANMSEWLSFPSEYGELPDDIDMLWICTYNDKIWVIQNKNFKEIFSKYELVNIKWKKYKKYKLDEELYLIVDEKEKIDSFIVKEKKWFFWRKIVINGNEIKFLVKYKYNRENKWSVGVLDMEWSAFSKFKELDSMSIEEHSKDLKKWF